jgi:hypothetical protein
MEREWERVRGFKREWERARGLERSGRGGGEES